MRSLFFKDAIGALTSVLFPSPCRICGQILLNATRIPICDDCLGSFEKIAEPMCQCCGRPFASTVSADAKQPLCRLCRLNFFAFDRARSFAIYNDALFEAIMLMKYEEVTSLGTWFAARIAEVIRETAGEWQADAVIPVPLHRARQRERGHNQAELICAATREGDWRANQVTLPGADQATARQAAALPQRALESGAWRLRD